MKASFLFSLLTNAKAQRGFIPRAIRNKTQIIDDINSTSTLLMSNARKFSPKHLPKTNITQKKSLSLVQIKKKTKKKLKGLSSSYLAPTTNEFLLTSNRRREYVVTLWSANWLDVANKSALTKERRKKKLLKYKKSEKHSLTSVTNWDVN